MRSEVQLDPNRTLVLYQLLKLEGLASSGGEAKLVIEQGYVDVNGSVEYRKRYQLKKDDEVTFNGVKIVCV